MNDLTFLPAMTQWLKHVLRNNLPADLIRSTFEDIITHFTLFNLRCLLTSLRPRTNLLFALAYKRKSISAINPSHPSIHMYFPHTVFLTFPVLKKRFCLKIMNFFRWWSFLLFLWPQSVIQGWNIEEKLDTSESKCSKGYIIRVEKFTFTGSLWNCLSWKRTSSLNSSVATESTSLFGTWKQYLKKVKINCIHAMEQIFFWDHYMKSGNALKGKWIHF